MKAMVIFIEKKQNNVFFCFWLLDFSIFFSQWKSPWLSYEVAFISALWMVSSESWKRLYLSELICTRLYFVLEWKTQHDGWFQLIHICQIARIESWSFHSNLKKNSFIITNLIFLNTNQYQFTWVPFYLFKFQSDVTINEKVNKLKLCLNLKYLAIKSFSLTTYLSYHKILVCPQL